MLFIFNFSPRLSFIALRNKSSVGIDLNSGLKKYLGKSNSHIADSFSSLDSFSINLKKLIFTPPRIISFIETISKKKKCTKHEGMLERRHCELKEKNQVS